MARAITKRSILRSGAFTLTEMLIAIGIMGVGLTMVSAMFPTAIRQEALTFEDTIGLQICQNGIAIAKASPSLRHPVCQVDDLLAGEWVNSSRTAPNAKWHDNQWLEHYGLVGSGTGATIFKIASNTSNTVTGFASGRVLGFSEYFDHRYPQGDTASLFGCTVLVRALSSGLSGQSQPNIYQFVSISYKRLNGSDSKVIVVPLQVEDNSSDRYSVKVVAARDNYSLVLGTPIIKLTTGEYTYVDKILSSDGLRGRLVQPLPLASGDLVGILVEKDVTARSPVLNVLVTQGAVRRVSP